MTAVLPGEEVVPLLIFPVAFLLLQIMMTIIAKTTTAAPMTIPAIPPPLTEELELVEEPLE